MNKQTMEVLVPDGYEIADIKVQYKPCKDNPAKIPVRIKRKSECRCGKVAELDDQCKGCYFRELARVRRMMQECQLQDGYADDEYY